jgi:hypothetical protein
MKYHGTNQDISPQKIEKQVAMVKHFEKLQPKSAVEWSPENLTELEPWWETKSLLPFKSCSSIVISGCTGSGKTQWIYRFLKNLPGMYIQDIPKAVLYCYGIYQDFYDVMLKTIPNFELHEGLPSPSKLEEFSADKQHKLIILDDLIQEVVQSPEIERLFTMGCHHNKLSTILVTQNAYQQGKHARTIALNTWYLVLMQTIRDKSQIAVMSCQIFPRHAKIFVA